MPHPPKKKLQDSHLFFLRIKEESRMAGVWLCIGVDVHPSIGTHALKEKIKGKKSRF